jgi:hypothetical protein
MTERGIRVLTAQLAYDTFCISKAALTSGPVAEKLPALGLPLNDLNDPRFHLTPSQKAELRRDAEHLSHAQRRRARYTVSHYEGDSKPILIVFLLDEKPGGYHVDYLVTNLSTCNIVYNPTTRIIFPTTSC